MEELLRVLQEISDKLSEISSKLDSINGVYGIDDIFEKIDDAADSIEQKIDDAADSIKGETGYDLTDIFKELSEINSNTSNIG